MAMGPAMRAAELARVVDIALHFRKFPSKILQALALDLGNSAKIAAAGAKSLASVAAPLHPLGFLELRPNSACMLLFCSAALQLRRADSTESVVRA
jgi:hypothetical protein